MRVIFNSSFILILILLLKTEKQTILLQSHADGGPHLFCASFVFAPSLRLGLSTHKKQNKQQFDSFRVVHEVLSSTIPHKKEYSTSHAGGGPQIIVLHHLQREKTKKHNGK